MNALSGTTTGAFDELLIRNPSFTGGYANVLDLLAGGSYDDSALSTRIDENAASISSQTTATTDALATKRSTADSYGVSELDGFLATKASTTELNTAITTLDDATTTRLTGKRDKEGSYSATQVDGFLDSKVAETVYQSGLSLKQDKENSYTSSEVDGLLGEKVSNSRVLTDVPANASFMAYTRPSLQTRIIHFWTAGTTGREGSEFQGVNGRTCKCLLHGLYPRSFSTHLIHHWTARRAEQ